MWNTLCRVSTSYLDDPESRKEIVRMLALHCPAGESPPATGAEGEAGEDHETSPG